MARATVAALLLLASAARADLPVTISNVNPRRDTDGNILDAHDGDVVVYNGTYFNYAAGYGLCTERTGQNGCQGGFTGCGFFNNHSVNLYTSPDMVTWTAHGNVLPVANRPQAILFSPKAIRDPATGTWILWYNFDPNYSYGVAWADTPYGPFQTVDDDVGASTQFGFPNNSDVGDFSLLVDDDGQGYILYSANHHCQIERLTANLSRSSYWVDGQQTSGVFPNGNEAPAIFKRAGTYYALISESCCYCGEGAKVHAYSASAPLGPYAYLGEIAAGPNPFNGTVATSAQQTNVVPLGEDKHAFLWQGDRWQSAPDRLKGHDFLYQTALTFFPNGSIGHLSWEDNFTVTP
jgi:hypothetical protein